MPGILSENLLAPAVKRECKSGVAELSWIIIFIPRHANRNLYGAIVKLTNLLFLASPRLASQRKNSRHGECQVQRWCPSCNARARERGKDERKKEERGKDKDKGSFLKRCDI
ncbi:hypothetical protein DBV15_01236 [Temnothorax longispinosus]|uniref:Uncharacterized protein n=1 Tax=Temnothorax longispinosus TaxID=300112 RepID=A0A4S2KPD9_9HYME|nr:hypothetical protein DBV15_01236 [Temnothorax longispinosus]